MKLLFFFYFHIKKDIYARLRESFLQTHHNFNRSPNLNRIKRPPGISLLQVAGRSFSPYYIYPYFIISKPQYGTNAFGMRMPSGVWLFSSNAATMRGKASAEPFNVWQSSVFLFAVR